MSVGHQKCHPVIVNWTSLGLSDSSDSIACSGPWKFYAWKTGAGGDVNDSSSVDSSTKTTLKLEGHSLPMALSQVLTSEGHQRTDVRSSEGDAEPPGDKATLPGSPG